MIRVVIADDHTIFRQGLKELLSSVPDIQVVGEAPDGRTARTLVTRLKPDVAILDIEMPGEGADGLSAAEAIAAEAPNTPVIILTMHADQDHLDRAVAAGVRGYVLKSAGLSELVGAIRAVAEGGSAVDPRLMTGLLRRYRERYNPLVSGPNGLTARELDVLRLLAAGYSNKEIARALKVSPSTVKNRLSVIFQKLGVTDRVAAALVAHSAGLVREGGRRP